MAKKKRHFMAANVHRVVQLQQLRDILIFVTLYTVPLLLEYGHFSMLL